MSLYESVLLEIEQGVTKSTFRASDFTTEARKVFLDRNGDHVEYYRVGFDFFAKSYIRSFFTNESFDPQTGVGGYSVKSRGIPPQFIKVEKGLYKIFDLTEDSEVDVCDEALPSVQPPSSGQSAEDRMAAYLENQSFQIHDRRRRKAHPPQPVVGFANRLNAYFWPNPGVSFQQTEAILQGFIKRATHIATDLDRNAQLALDLFGDICNWGGVRVPTQDPLVVIANIKTAKKASAAEPAAMNSAWTKLYAIFYPDAFVIHDSRVATAIVGVAEAVFDDAEVTSFKAVYPALGCVAGRGGSRPRGTRTAWRNAYTSWQAQLDANRLSLKILAALNTRPGRAFTLRELEAVLFMEGY